jgi:aromatic ring-opening dioxygenase catalytic subunit (LigB family)
VGFIRELPSNLRKPDAILVISAHWEESVPKLLGAAKPELFYDYYGFPEESYQITYPAPGSPELAGRIVDLLSKKNIPPV